MSKNELRKNVIAGRNALSAQEVGDKSKIISRKLLELKEYHHASTVMAYVDFRNEVQTADIIKTTLQDGKTLVVPVTDVANKRLTPTILKRFPDDLTPGAWGILEPNPDGAKAIHPEKIDLVIIPGVAFDTVGNRLGYGGGFYDRFLTATRPDAILLSLAYEMQIRPNVYPGEHDIPIHMLVTEERIMDFRKARR